VVNKHIRSSAKDLSIYRRTDACIFSKSRKRQNPYDVVLVTAALRLRPGAICGFRPLTIEVSGTSWCDVVQATRNLITKTILRGDGRTSRNAGQQHTLSIFLSAQHRLFRLRHRGDIIISTVRLANQRYAAYGHIPLLNGIRNNFKIRERQRQPIGMLGRSSGNHDWLLANVSACVSCGFRLRNARNASDCVFAFEWKPGFSQRISRSLVLIKLKRLPSCFIVFLFYCIGLICFVTRRLCAGLL